MYLLSPVQSPLSLWAIDTLALAGLTRGFVCCGQHSSLSPDGIYCVLCFNIHSVWVEINFSFGPNCLFAPAAQALQPWAPPFQQRRPTAASTQLYFLPNYMCQRPTATSLWGFGELFLLGGNHWWCLSDWELVVLTDTIWWRCSDPDCGLRRWRNAPSNLLTCRVRAAKSRRLVSPVTRLIHTNLINTSSITCK